MENANCPIFEKKLLNDLRKITPEKRKEILSLIEYDEQIEKEELQKNPNLYLEKQMKAILSELQDLRHEIQLLQNRQFVLHPDKLNTIENTILECDNTLDDNDSFSLFSFDWLPIFIFFIMIFITFLTPSKLKTQ